MSWLSCLFIIYISFKLNVNYLRALDCAHLLTSRGRAVSGLPQLADEHFGSHCLARPARTAFGLTTLFIGERGDAFVDLSGEVRGKHPGGALGELFTVYAIVNAITVNLPAITRVQILIDGKEADTLAGHVDLRHPLQKNLKWTELQTDTDK